MAGVAQQQSFVQPPARMEGSGDLLHQHLLLEVVSKPQIRFKGKAQADEKVQHTR
jgi:hypothetical protein